MILTCPATLNSLYFGQTGAFCSGLLMLALSAGTRGDAVSVISAALLTIKPQLGFLLPVLWAVQKKWALIALVSVATLLLGLASIAFFGPGPWYDYLSHSLPLLNQIERQGDGAFMRMIPSMFMAGRIVSGNESTAAILHFAFAALVAVYVVERLVRLGAPDLRTAMVMIGTVAITPYVHAYDLVPLLCGALIMARYWAESQPAPRLASYLLLLMAWGMPNITSRLNEIGVPLSPLLMLAILVAAGHVPAGPKSPIPDQPLLQTGRSLRH